MLMASTSDRVQAGDALAKQVWDEACYYLAAACVTMQHVVNPQAW